MQKWIRLFKGTWLGSRRFILKGFSRILSLRRWLSCLGKVLSGPLRPWRYRTDPSIPTSYLTLSQTKISASPSQKASIFNQLPSNLQGTYLALPFLTKPLLSKPICPSQTPFSSKTGNPSGSRSFQKWLRSTRQAPEGWCSMVFWPSLRSKW